MTRTPQPPRRGRQGGNLDVPLSVIPSGDTAGEDLEHALIAFYTRPGQFVLDATGAVLVAATTMARRSVALVPDVLAADLEHDLAHTDRAVGELGQIRRVDLECLPATLAGYLTEADLIVAAGTATEQPGWWTACRGALTTGGHVAIAPTVLDTSLHTDLVTRATAAGMGYAQHLIVASTTALDDALTEASIGDARVRTRVHRRSHRDVYVFTSPGPIGAVNQ